jgi:hypothetical protein
MTSPFTPNFDQNSDAFQAIVLRPYIPPSPATAQNEIEKRILQAMSKAQALARLSRHECYTLLHAAQGQEKGTVQHEWTLNRARVNLRHWLYLQKTLAKKKYELALFKAQCEAYALATTSHQTKGEKE